MRAAEQEFPNLLQRFEHEHSDSVIHLRLSKAMTLRARVGPNEGRLYSLDCAIANFLGGRTAPLEVNSLAPTRGFGAKMPGKMGEELLSIR
jgi:hypothetical protein